MRQRLPNRRNSAVTDVIFHEERWHVAWSRYGWFGPIAEVFVRGPKSGSHMDALGYSIGTTLSIALQHGVPLDELAHSVCRLEDGSPADIVGAILDALIAEDRTFTETITP
jgi:hypothetical protein